MRPENLAFAERLKSSRFRVGYASPGEAARAFGWNENTYKSRENGFRGIPAFAEVRAYARAFKVPFVWLLTGEGASPQVEIARNGTDHPAPVPDPPFDPDAIAIAVRGSCAVVGFEGKNVDDLVLVLTETLIALADERFLRALRAWRDREIR